MLIKLFLDDTFPIDVPGGPQQCNWVVQENLPVSHVKQAEALLKALHLPQSKLAELNLRAVYFTYLGNFLDSSKSFADLNVKAGSIISCTTMAPSPKASFRNRTFTNSPRGFTGSPSFFLASPSMIARDFDEDEDRMNSPRGALPPAEEAEHYDASDCGWFPFVVATSSYGLPGVTFPNPEVEVAETDTKPNTWALCEQCGDLVLHCDGAAIPVDRHYKPVLMRMEVVEGKVEKLGGSRFPRWQPRWLCISDKTLDWFEADQKSGGGKSRPKGSRAFFEGAVLQIDALLENPDPAVHKKCNDPKYFHFGVVFKPESTGEPPSTMLFRATTQQEKTKYVQFLASIVKKAANKGASRDPVHWKKWADTFLVTLADVGHLSKVNDDEEETLMREVAQLEQELREIQETKPRVATEIEQHKRSVVTLNAEVEQRTAQLAAVEERVRDAEARVAMARAEFNEAEQAVAEELKMTQMLERRAKKKHEETTCELERLQREVIELNQRQAELFTQWRKVEERHATEGDRGDSLAPSLSFSVDGTQLSAGQARSMIREWSTRSSSTSSTLLEHKDVSYQPASLRRQSGSQSPLMHHSYSGLRGGSSSPLGSMRKNSGSGRSDPNLGLNEHSPTAQNPSRAWR